MDIEFTSDEPKGLYVVTGGENATINCTAFSEPVPNEIAFFKDDELLQTEMFSVDDSLISEIVVSNETVPVYEVTGTLTIANAVHKQSGLYVCRAANGGIAETEEFTVKVEGIPLIWCM